MGKKNKLVKFGEDVEGYNIPVLNEREIRAAAGILFLWMFISFLIIQFKQDFLLIKYFIVVFLADLIIRVFVNPKYSPSLIIGRLIVSRQVPEYVGAPQKKFAWKIGIALASLMFFLLVIVNSYSIITAAGCLICLSFLFFESAFGICLGCLFYGLFYKDKSKYCSGEICEVTKKHDIQRISRAQILIIFGFAVYIVITIVFFNGHFSEKPKSLWDIIKSFS
ncbi:MAG: DUF4395 domain-containing protein [Flavisolibacter sp.]